MEKARKNSKLLASRFIIVMQVNSSLFVLHSQLYECCNDFLTSSWQHVDDWNLWHGVATWLQTE